MRRSTLLAAVAASALASCSESNDISPEPVVTPTPEPSLASDEKMAVDSVSNNLDELIKIYDNSDGQMKKYAEDTIGELLSEMEPNYENRRKVYDLLRKYTRASGIRNHLLNARDEIGS